MIKIEGVVKWLRGVREPVGYNWDAAKIAVLPKRMLAKSLEWKRVSVVGFADVDHELAMKAAGWKPVFSIFGRAIERDGLRLMWRERAITDAAIASGIERAQALVNITYVEIPLLTMKGLGVRWGFDPYEGTGMDEALKAVDDLVKADRLKERVVPLRNAGNDADAGLSAAVSRKP